MPNEPNRIPGLATAAIFRRDKGTGIQILRVGERHCGISSNSIKPSAIFLKPSFSWPLAPAVPSRHCGCRNALSSSNGNGSPGRRQGLPLPPIQASPARAPPVYAPPAKSRRSRLLSPGTKVTRDVGIAAEPMRGYKRLRQMRPPGPPCPATAVNCLPRGCTWQSGTGVPLAS